MQKATQGFVKKFDEVDEMDMPGGATIRWLITHKEGAPTFSMRFIKIDKGKASPAHSHDYEHEIYVISGKGEFTIGDQKLIAEKDHFAFIPGNVYHNMRAIEDMKLICVVPIKAAKEILGE